MKPDLVLVADGGPRLGSGHWMRMTALGAAAQAQGMNPLMVTRTTGEALRHSPVPVLALMDYKELPQHVEGWGDPPVVVDTPHPVPVGCARHLTVVTDNGDRVRFDADLIVNGHIHGDTIPYLVRPNAQTLTGPRFALLRRQFQELRREPVNRPVHRVLVCLGGGVKGEARWPGIRANIEAQGMEAVPFGGSRYGHYTDVARAMLNCDLIVTTASMTALEAMCLGLPVLTYTVTPHQEPVQARMLALGLVKRFGVEGLLDPPDPTKGFELVDGRGCDRVLSSLRAAAPGTGA